MKGAGVLWLVGFCVLMGLRAGVARGAQDSLVGGPDALAAWARAVGAGCNAAASAERALGNVVALRVGAEGPTVVVLVDGGTPEGSAQGLEQLARLVAQEEPDLGRCGLLLVSTPAEGPTVAGVDPGLNFPWRWQDARRAHGARAGAFPGQVPWVAGVSDVLLRARGVVAVVDLRPGAGTAEPDDGPGRLGGLVRGRLGVGSTRGGGESAVLAAFRALPSLAVERPVWRRLTTDLWAVDFRVAAPLGPERIELELDITSLDGSLSLAAFAAAPDGPGALELVPMVGGRLRLEPLDAGGMRCRAVFSAKGTLTGPPAVRVEAFSARALGVQAVLEAPKAPPTPASGQGESL